MQPRHQLLALCLAFAATSVAAQVVIVNAQNATSALSKEQAEQIFLGRSTSFPGGAQAIPIDNEAARNAFYQALAGKSGDQVKAYWTKLEFTGKGKAPAEVATGKAAAAEVAKNAAAIGYVDKAEVGAGAKAVLTLP